MASGASTEYGKMNSEIVIQKLLRNVVSVLTKSFDHMWQVNQEFQYLPYSIKHTQIGFLYIIQKYLQNKSKYLVKKVL